MAQIPVVSVRLPLRIQVAATAEAGRLGAAALEQAFPRRIERSVMHASRMIRILVESSERGLRAPSTEHRDPNVTRPSARSSSVVR